MVMTQKERTLLKTREQAKPDEPENLSRMHANRILSLFPVCEEKRKYNYEIKDFFITDHTK